MMKAFDKDKNISSNKQNGGNRTRRILKYAGLGLLAVGNITSVVAVTVAWFNLNTRDSTIDMVSGDLGVEIRKVTAYKYVYPYYQHSTEFIDYDSEGVVKSYVLEDHELVFDTDYVDDIPITSDDATVALGIKASGQVTTNPAQASSSKICIPESSPSAYIPDFRYYLVGDNVFCGLSNSWELASSYAFASTETIEGNKEAVLDNIVVSAGSSFRLIEAYDSGSSTFAYNYFPIESISETSSPFRVVDDNDDQNGDRLLCLRSGIYKFTYSEDQLKIELHTSDSGNRKDISVITNNSLDPTKISIDYAGSVNKTEPEEDDYFPTIDSYMPTAIHNQNTTVILDVELNFSNANEVDASLQIQRTTATSNSIYNVPNKYSDTTHNLVGYLDDEHQNQLRSSDFYNYYALFTKTPYASASALWTSMHRIGDTDSKKFANGESYDTIIDCPLNLKENDDSTLIPANNPDSGVDHIYHCYIAIEYDYEHSTYFLDKNRLGKTYLLDRDFGFHFFGDQHKETI